MAQPTKKESILLELKIAELQFRLAAMARLTIFLEEKSLDAPMIWSHGKHTVNYADIFLTQDQSEIAAHYLEQTATYFMSITIKHALEKEFGQIKDHRDSNIVAAYQIARLIRNSFLHSSPMRPIWHIDEDYKDREFIVDGVISLNTKGLDKQPFDWRHYGGLLALFQLSKYVRIELLKDTDIGKDRKITSPKTSIFIQGNLILQSVDKFSKNSNAKN